MSDNTSYRKLLNELEQFANELATLAEEAEGVANDLARGRRNRDLAAGVAAAYYGASNDVLRILCHALDSDDD